MATASIGLPSYPLRPVIIQTRSASTSLVQVGSNYFLDTTVSGSSGPEIKYLGAPATVGEFGAVTPIGAALTSTGYEVAWRFTGTNSYTVWNTDSNGNYVSDTIGIVAGNSTTLESLEASFNQDLNGDGVIGILKSGYRCQFDRVDQPGAGREQLLPLRSWWQWIVRS